MAGQVSVECGERCELRRVSVSCHEWGQVGEDVRVGQDTEDNTSPMAIAGGEGRGKMLFRDVEAKSGEPLQERRGTNGCAHVGGSPGRQGLEGIFWML